MVSAECEPIMEVWSGAPSGVQRHNPWSEGRSLPWSWRYFVIQKWKWGANLYIFVTL